MRVFAIFDCCSTALSNHKGLLKAVEGKGEDGILVDPDDTKSITFCQYIHFSPARPNGIAASDAKNTQKIYKWMQKFSLDAPAGYLSIFSDINKIPGGNCSISGGKEYLIPFETEKLRT